MKKITHHCDACGEQISYRDSDGDIHVAGIAVMGQLDFHTHIATHTGSTHKPVPPYKGGEYCSFTCLAAGLNKSLSQLEGVRAFASPRDL